MSKEEIIKTPSHGDELPVTFNTSYEMLDGKLDELEEKKATVNIVSEYWGGDSGAEIGETRRCFFLGFKFSVNDEGEQLEVAEFVYKKNGSPTVFRNASTVLVGILKDGSFKEGAAFEITYDGKGKAQSGRNFDKWQIKPLI